MIKNFQELIQQIKDQIPIHELISEYIPLKKSGRSYVALCPFHDDHKPSMHVNSEKGIFKCFSCGTGGDIIYFYSQINKKKFPEAIADLAAKYNLKVEYGTENTAEFQLKNEIFNINRDAVEFYKRNLFQDDNKSALEYLTDVRGYDLETIKKYELGFALNSWDSLYKFLLRGNKYSNDVIISSGLFSQKENSGDLYDRFRNRIIIPIFNEVGSVIAFGGRAVMDEEPKYLNSPETPVFHKGSCLYGLNSAKEEIKKSDFVILTEGYFDVITAHKYGLLNTVAPLGTALTGKQARLLGKYSESKKLCLCLDSDKAGRKAVESVFRLINDSQNPVFLDVTVISDLGGKDLDETLKLNGKDFLLRKISSAQKIVNFILDSTIQSYLEISSAAEKKNIFELILDVICNIADPVEQKTSTGYVAHKLAIEEEMLAVKVKDKLRSKQGFRKDSRQSASQDEGTHTMHTSERFKQAELELLSLYVCSFPHNKLKIKNELEKIEFIDDKHKLIKDYLDNISENDIVPEQVLTRLMTEFNEFKHIMISVSEIAWRINSESVSAYVKSEEKILKESKEWIGWWVKNKQQLKSLSDKLKDCKDNGEGTKILSEMIEVVRKMEQVQG